MREPPKRGKGRPPKLGRTYRVTHVLERQHVEALEEMRSMLGHDSTSETLRQIVDEYAKASGVYDVIANRPPSEASGFIRENLTGLSAWRIRHGETT